MCVSDLDNSRNSDGSNGLAPIGPRQAVLLNVVRWILGHIPLFKNVIQLNDGINSESYLNAGQTPSG